MDMKHDFGLPRDVNAQAKAAPKARWVPEIIVLAAIFVAVWAIAALQCMS